MAKQRPPKQAQAKAKDYNNLRPHEKRVVDEERRKKQSQEDRTLWRPPEISPWDFTCETGIYCIRGKESLYIHGFLLDGKPDYSTTKGCYTFKWQDNAIQFVLKKIRWSKQYAPDYWQMEIYNTSIQRGVRLFDSLPLENQLILLGMTDPRDLILLRDNFPSKLKKALRKKAQNV